MIGKKAVRQPKRFQAGDLPLTWADISKAGRLLGYRPETDLATGLHKFVVWYRAASPMRRASAVDNKKKRVTPFPGVTRP
jgi:nucleoside-diphosphate-sugar epimerase